MIFPNVRESMNLGIVIPLKSKQISRDWKITSAALQLCLDSIKRQTFTDFTVVVCGHDKPDFLESEEYQFATFTTSHFPPPDREKSDFSHKDLILDKNLKIALAVRSIHSESISHWYQLDSDDLLHKDFVKIALTAVEGKAGAIIDGGYLLYTKQKRAISTHEMSMYCGSTSIISSQYMVFPDVVGLDTLRDIPWARYPHMGMNKFFEGELNEPYSVIHEKVLGYVLASGDNISDKWRNSPIKMLKAVLKPYVKGQRISSSIKDAFGIR
jgi:hypothetical protein